MWRIQARLQSNEPLASLRETGCSEWDKALQATASSRCLERTDSAAELPLASSFPRGCQRSSAVLGASIPRANTLGMNSGLGSTASECLPGAGVKRAGRDWSSPLGATAGGGPAGCPRLRASATQPPARAGVTAAEETATAEPQRWRWRQTRLLAGVPRLLL